MNIIESILTESPCYKMPSEIKVKGIMLHSVGCPQPSAKVFVHNWNKSTYNRACVHAFIDANTGDVYQTLPWIHRGWHSGGKANDTHIGVEMCEPSQMKYVGPTAIMCADREKVVECVKRTYSTAVELFAKLCNDFKLDPMKPGVIISHSEGAKLCIASNHADPEHLWKQLGLQYTMDTFRNDVKNKMNVNEKSLYCVQVGAFRVRQNAENLLKKLKEFGVDGYITIKGG